MLYYAFFFWCKPKPSIETNTAVFSYHKNNDYIAVFIGLLTLFIGESFAAHYFLATIDNTVTIKGILADFEGNRVLTNV